MYSQIVDPTTGQVLPSIRRDADSAIIPDDPNNADWQAYQVWLATGNSPTAAPVVMPPGATLTFLQFMGLFTASEQAAIVGSTDIKVRLFVVMASGSGGLQLSNAEVVDGVDYLGSTGLLSSSRVAAILAGTPPT